MRTVNAAGRRSGALFERPLLPDDLLDGALPDLALRPSSGGWA